MARKGNHRGRSSGRKFAVGKRAWSLCDRCGFRYLYRDIRNEPGTHLRVCSKCDDGSYSKVMHPQLYPADAKEAIGLQFARPDRNETTVSICVYTVENETGVSILPGTNVTSA